MSMTATRNFALWVCFLVLVHCVGACAQDAGSVVGAIVSTWDGAPLSSAVVTVRGTTLAARSDANGRFQLGGVPPGEHTLRFSKSGFASANVTEVRVLAGQTTTVNGNLRPEFFDMEEYEVTAEEFTQQSEQIMIERQNSSAMVEALGSEFISRLGAANAAESISKVSGATIVDGKSAVIRGLNDRYISTTLNGANIPSADPYRQSASLDMFPSQVIDRVVVAKTFTPDQPGTYTGGGIDIVTKSFPEKRFLSLSLGGAFNQNANLNGQFLTYKGGGLDWAATDDGGRALPATISQEAPIGAQFPTPQVGNLLTNSPVFNQRMESQLRLDRLSRDLGTTEFAPRTQSQPLNYNFSGAGGGSAPLYEGLLGYFAAVSYKQDFSSYDNGVSQRYQGGTELKNNYRDARSLSTVNWSGMVNLGYKPLENHELGFTFFYNQNALDEARIQDEGFDANNSTSGSFRKFNLYWTERNLTTYQIKGEHHFPTFKDLQFNWLIGLAQTTQDEPNARFFNDNDSGSGYESGGKNSNPKDPTRYFRGLDEGNQNFKLDWGLPFRSWTGEDARLKWGLFDSSSDRTFDERQFYYSGGGGYNNDPNHFLTDENLGLLSIRRNARSVGFQWANYAQVFDSFYDADRGVQAAFLMVELPVVKNFKFVGGARLETTDMRVHSVSYLDSSITAQKTNDTLLAQVDILPSVGMIYSIATNMNLRLSYSQTIARPGFRELAAYYSYDPIVSDFVEGNPLLNMTAIRNYDVRWEWFRRPGELFSVSLFYKELEHAIERGNVKQEGDVITYFNSDAKLYGIEFEARKSLEFAHSSLSPFSVGGNLALVESEVQIAPNDLGVKRSFFHDTAGTRALYDQSPYILNLDLSYTGERTGTSASVIYNIAGPRIALTKLNTADVYEQAVPSLDFVASQKIGPHASVKFAVKNLLDPKVERTYGESGEFLYSSYSRGRSFGLSFSYDF